MRYRVTLLLLLPLIMAACGSQTTTVTVTKTVQPEYPEKLYRLPSGSMEPTLKIGQKVVIAEGEPPKLGSIVVFHPPEGATEEACGPIRHTVTLGAEACSHPVEQEASVTFVKRIVAGPGEQLYIREGHVYHRRPRGSFTREEDSYIKPCGASPECNFPKPITVPSNDWFLMGDNRGESDDSRFWGPVPTEWLIGTVIRTLPLPYEH